MKQSIRNFNILLLIVLLPLVTACDEDGDLLVNNSGLTCLEGMIYGKTNRDNHGSTGLMLHQGYTYKVVKIGDQWWMAENLRSTTYKDGTPIVHAKDDYGWATVTEGAYCAYNNDANHESDTYGYLYNFLAASDPRGIAPKGWQVATDDDWKQLEMFLGMSQASADSTGYRGGSNNEGGKLRETGTAHWPSPNDGATNESGFTAIPGGERRAGGGTAEFQDIGDQCNFWTSTGDDASGWMRNLDSFFLYSPMIQRTDDSRLRYGYSIRCVKD